MNREAHEGLAGRLILGGRRSNRKARVIAEDFDGSPFIDAAAPWREEGKLVRLAASPGSLPPLPRRHRRITTILGKLAHLLRNSPAPLSHSIMR
jgi:hypothetical protein